MRITCETAEEAGWQVAPAKRQLGFAIEGLGLEISSVTPRGLSCPTPKRLGLEIDEARLPALLVYRARALVRAEFAADVADADAVEDLLDGCL